VMTRSDVGKGHPEYYQDMAQRIASETPGAFYIDQFSNPANPSTHETWTAPEIWEQMEQRIDAIVCGVGTGGTLTGIGRFMQRIAPHVQMVLADPKGSVLADVVNTGTHGEAGSWLIEGIGEDFVPANCDLNFVAKAYTIADAESLLTARDLLAKEGIFAGSSAGTLLAAALCYCREQRESRRVVTIVPDAGGKYLSKMFNDYWLMEQGIIEREHKGDLSDLIARKHRERATVTISPDDMLMTALGRMKLYDFQQLPVLDGDKVVGIIDESDILMAVVGRGDRFRDPVRSAMSSRIETVPADTDVDALLPIFNKGHVAIVMDGDRFLGLITRYDLLTYLRRRTK
jgi:cystathionine beta-synthase